MGYTYNEIHNFLGEYDAAQRELDGYVCGSHRSEPTYGAKMYGSKEEAAIAYFNISSATWFRWLKKYNNLEGNDEVIIARKDVEIQSLRDEIDRLKKTLDAIAYELVPFDLDTNELLSKHKSRCGS